jgi:hypothetical protein
VGRAEFDATVEPSGRGGGHLVVVPPEAIETLGGRGRIAVRATFDGIPYRGSVVRMGDVSVLGVLKAVMAEAGVGAGDRLHVAIENDDAPREVEVPDDLAKALRANRAARRRFDSLSYSHRREHVRHVTEAKGAETRARRIERTVAALAEQDRSRSVGRHAGSS